MSRQIAIFYHVYVTTNVLLWIDEQLGMIFKSGLMDVATLKINLLYKNYESMKDVARYIDSNYDLTNVDVTWIKEHHPKPRYEAHTLMLIQQYCKANPDHKVLYIHTKGISRPFTDKDMFPSNKNKPWTYNWRNCMQWHCIINYTSCLKDLESHDIVGTKWVKGPAPPHFSGNFWWARADYINKLQDPMHFPRWWLWGRFSCEFWIGGSTIDKVSGRPKWKQFIPAKDPPRYKNYPYDRYMFTSPIDLDKL